MSKERGYTIAVNHEVSINSYIDKYEEKIEKLEEKN